MRLSALPLPLALLLLASSFEASGAISPPAQSSLAAPSLFVRPRFLPPDNYRRRLAKRQDTASAGTGTAPGTSLVDVGNAAATTPPEPAQTTTEAAQTSSPAAATTTEAPATTAQPTSSAAAETTPAQETTETSQQQATTTTQPAASPTAGSSTTAAPNPASSAPTNAPSSSGSNPAQPSNITDSKAAAESSQSAESASKAAASSSITNVEVTFTSTFTNSDGSVGTSTGTMMTPSAVPVKNNTGGSSTGKTWGIVGGVVGGAILVGALVFVVYRMTQRRFSSLDNDDLEEIKWPELQQDGGLISANTSTLKPLETHRTGGAGIGDDDDDGASAYGGPRASGGGDMGAGGMYGVHGRKGSESTLLGMGAAQHSRNASYEQLAMADSGGYGGGPQGHYDPFLGPAAYPPPPANVHSQQAMVYPPQQYALGGGSPYSDHYHDGDSEHLSQSPSLSRDPSASAYSGSEPRGAPGAGGARGSIASGSFSPPRVASPPVGTRTESPFRVPSPAVGGGLGIDMQERRGPL
ncbi:hypothetical protein JCM10213_002093 [Rhodosporidiobolus nylandii]